MAKLDPRYRKFVHNYFHDPETIGKADRSAIMAGYSKDYATTHAHSFVGECREKSKNKVIWDLVAAEREKLERDYEMSEEEIKRQYKRLCNFDIRKLYDAKGNPKPIHELDDDTAACIAGVDTTVRRKVDKKGKAQLASVTRKLKITDKKGALDSMAKIKGMFRDGDGEGGGDKSNIHVHVYMPDNGR